jgi:hypothetical protein
LKKFDMDAAIERRIKELRGELMIPEDIDVITRYTQERMRALHQQEHSKTDLDRSCLACYTIGTMGDRDGET